ncbi:hypothetical protein ACFLSZ_05075 [Candidatus Bipolaricaulota bacterium]
MRQASRLLPAALIAGLLLGVFGQAWASMSVAPLSLQFDVAPGESASGSFLVRNTGSEAIEVSISLHDWWRTEAGDLQILPAGDVEQSCAEWLVYSSSSALLAPGEETEISLELAIPEDAVGDHWTMFLVEEHPQPAEQAQADKELTDTTRVVVAYAVKVLQRDPVNRTLDATISDVAIDQEAPLQIAITYANTGSAHHTTSGTVEIRDTEGETIQSIDVNPFPTLPGEIRTLLVLAPETMEALPGGIYYTVVILDFGGDYLIQGGSVFEVEAESQDT